MSNTNHTLLDAVQLDLSANRARKAGLFDAAVAFDGLSSALRSGQLSRRELNTSDSRVRLFAGRALDV